MYKQAAKVSIKTASIYLYYNNIGKAVRDYPTGRTDSAITAARDSSSKRRGEQL